MIGRRAKQTQGGQHQETGVMQDQHSPEKPVLKLLVWAPNDQGLRMPEAVCAKWSHVAEFQALRKELGERFGELTPGKVVVKSEESPCKRQKTKDDFNLASYISDVPQGELIAGCQITLGAQRSLEFNFYTGGGVYLKNAGKQDEVLVAHLPLVGFPSTGSKFGVVTGTPDKETTITFRLTDHNDPILYVGPQGGTPKPTTLREVINPMRAESPEQAKVVFHTLDDTVGQETGSFSLTPTHQVIYQAKQLITMTAEVDEQKKGLSVNTAGAAIPLDMWEKSATARVLFIMKWQPRGLVPVSCKLCLRQQVELATNKFLKIL